MDCNPDGAYTLTVWYELVPAPTRTIKMTVEPGDRIIANMRVVGHRVTVAIADTTRAEYFARTIADHRVDDTSAEWIAEAPSALTDAGRTFHVTYSGDASTTTTTGTETGTGPGAGGGGPGAGRGGTGPDG